MNVSEIDIPGASLNGRLPAYEPAGQRTWSTTHYLRWLDTVFFLNGNSRFRSIFSENYYLFENNEYFS